MASNMKIEYNVDIAMVIDATGSMQPILDTVKRNALNFYGDFLAKMQQAGKKVAEVRVRLIAFRDYLADNENAMMLTPFFKLPDQTDEFEHWVNSIEEYGGGDDPEDGLEAIGYAIKSKWTEGGNKRRHIIIVWSDDGTHELGFGRDSEYYPSKMAASFSELTEWWDELMDMDSKRLLLYAPEKEYWTTIADTWDNVLFFPSEAGRGLDKLTYDEIMYTIAKSI